MSDEDRNLNVQLIEAVLSLLVRGLHVIYPTPPPIEDEDDQSSDRENEDDDRDSSDDEDEEEGEEEIVEEDDFPYTFTDAMNNDDADARFGQLCDEYELNTVIETVLYEIDLYLDSVGDLNLLTTARDFVEEQEEVFLPEYIDMISSYLQFADPDNAEEHTEHALELHRELMKQELSQDDDEPITIEEEPTAEPEIVEPPPAPEPESVVTEPAPEPVVDPQSAAPSRPRRRAAPAAPPDPGAAAASRPRRTAAQPIVEPEPEDNEPVVEPEPEPRSEPVPERRPVARRVKKGRSESCELPLADDTKKPLTRAQISALSVYTTYIELVLRAIDTQNNGLLRQLFMLALPELRKVADGQAEEPLILPDFDQNDSPYDDDWWEANIQAAAKQLVQDIEKRLKRAGYLSAPTDW
jgi:hypothetical protein